MADPLRSLGNAPTVSSTELSCEHNGLEPANASLAPPASSSDVLALPAEQQLDPGVALLVRSYTSSVRAPAQQPVGDNNAERAARTPAETFHVSAGWTGNNSYHVTAGLAYGFDSATGAVMELGGVSLQGGPQTEVQLTATRATIADEHGNSLSAEALTFQAGLGVHNKDGSQGYNVSLGATLVGAEGTADFGGGSITLGASIGLTAEASSGVRDRDGDGARELCVRVAVPAVPISGGVCLEEPKGW